MRGAEWSWREDDDEVHKISAVLAGLAVIIGQSPEYIRKGDAFRGRIALPFLETLPPAADTLRLSLVAESCSWCVYSIGDNGAPRVRAMKSGFRGFCEMALLLSKTIKT